MADRPHHFVSGRCFVCRRLIAFDPSRVPSVALTRDGLPLQNPRDRIDHTEPLCRRCARDANAERRRNGLTDKWDTDPSIWQPVEGIPE